MQTVVVVNGTYDWTAHFPGMRVVQVAVGRSRWLIDRGRLWIVDRRGHHRPDAVLWRLGAVTPAPLHRTCLEMIRMSGVPCVNDAATLLRGYDRLGMLHELRSAGLPVIEFSVCAGEGALSLISPGDMPAVLKVGNLHGGLGKARIESEVHWQETTALVPLVDGYATIEPFVRYKRDVRCMAVGCRMWAMRRQSDTWRANVDTVDYVMIEPPEALRSWTRQAMTHLNADVLGLDYLEGEDGEWVLLESNDIPGVLGYPDEVPRAIAQQLMQKMNGLSAH